MCGHRGGGWEIKGWFSLEPGETKTLFTTSNPDVGYYAEADDGYVWRGSGSNLFATEPVNDNMMDWCDDRHPPDTHAVEMRRVNLPPAPSPTAHLDHTVNLMY